MRTIELKVTSPADGSILAEFAWHDGILVPRTICSELLPAFNRWSRDGLREWVHDERGGRVQRVTEMTDAAFLPRLAAHLRKQSNFSTELSDRQREVLVGRKTLQLIRNKPGNVVVFFQVGRSTQEQKIPAVRKPATAGSLMQLWTD